jgi:hypothetical protein
LSQYSATSRAFSQWRSNRTDNVSRPCKRKRH